MSIQEKLVERAKLALARNGRTAEQLGYRFGFDDKGHLCIDFVAHGSVVVENQAPGAAEQHVDALCHVMRHYADAEAAAFE